MMPLWAWLILIALIGYFAYRLAHAWISGENRYGPFIYSRENLPYLFWFFFSIDLLMVLFFMGVLVMIIRHQAA
jgi:hypothetical protein